jgi:hypothetical protein
MLSLVDYTDSHTMEVAHGNRLVLIIIFFIYFNCACTITITPYTQQTPDCTTVLYLMALLGARTPYLLSIGKWGFHTCSHPYGGCVGRATMVRTTVVKTHVKHREMNPTPVARLNSTTSTTRARLLWKSIST